MTTFPIATAILIGLVLNVLTRKPWVVDFRDSMTEENYPPEKYRRKLWRWLERQAMHRGSLFIFTAESACEMYRSRYPHVPSQRFVVIPNGYDENDFTDVFHRSTAPRQDAPLKLLHLGFLYPEERDPKPFFAALARLRKMSIISPGNLLVHLRDPKFEQYHQDLINQYGIHDMVHVLPPLPYHDALQEAASADGLLLFQAACCNHQIPAKVYEYMRLQRPILALTCPSGDTARVLQHVGGATFVDIADENAIFEAIPTFLERIRTNSHPKPDPEKAKSFSRQAQTHSLARQLDSLVY
jgi:glycosyltransferase involved in cell wall biosynthesis